MSCFSKLAQSTIKRPYQSRTSLTNKNFNQKVNTAKEKVYTAKPKAVNTARPTSAVVNAVRANQVNVVKASACWVWRPTKLNSALITFKRQNYIDARDRSKHMTGNMSYLSDFKEFDGGYVTFGGGARGGRINGKGTLKTGLEESNGACYTSKETKFSQYYIVMPLWKDGSMFDSSSKISSDDEPQPSSNAEKKNNEGVSKASGFSDQEQPESSTLNINTTGPSINTASAKFKTGSLNINIVSPTVITTRSNRSQNVSDMFSLGRSATHEATHADLFGDETEMNMSNLTTSYQEEPKRIAKALCDPSWVEAMQEEILQFKLQKVWILVDLPKGKRAIAIKWIFRNKKNERGIVTRNKARLVAQGYSQEEDGCEEFFPLWYN
ncbi:ribonuclease H-like domain-containing protein [Tanacetum coccineum]